MFDEMPSPAPGYLTVAEAAQRLGVSQDMVRKLIAHGDLPAARVGGVSLLIPETAVDLRRAQAAGRGRRFTPSNAWGVLFLAAGLPAGWLMAQARWRANVLLRDQGLRSLRSRLVSRGRPVAYRGHPGVLEDLRADPDVMLTGTTGATALSLGLIGGADRVEAYVTQPALEALVARHHLRPSREPNVFLQVVPDFGWSWPPAHIAPISAIGLDLLDNPEPRAQQVGDEILEGLPK